MVSGIPPVAITKNRGFLSREYNRKKVYPLESVVYQYIFPQNAPILHTINPELYIIRI
jgi:hypothetical protein